MAHSAARPDSIDYKRFASDLPLTEAALSAAARKRPPKPPEKPKPQSASK
jgi:hypothetical protein